MGAARKVPNPVFYPGRTAWGSVGECVHFGMVIPPPNEHAQGTHVYLSPRELREGLLAMGWPTQEHFDELKVAHDAAVAKLAAVEAERDEAVLKASELEAAIKYVKPKRGRPPKVKA